MKSKNFLESSLKISIFLLVSTIQILSVNQVYGHHIDPCLEEVECEGEINHDFDHLAEINDPSDCCSISACLWKNLEEKGFSEYQILAFMGAIIACNSLKEALSKPKLVRKDVLAAVIGCGIGYIISHNSVDEILESYNTCNDNPCHYVDGNACGDNNFCAESHGDFSCHQCPTIDLGLDKILIDFDESAPPLYYDYGAFIYVENVSKGLIFQRDMTEDLEIFWSAINAHPGDIIEIELYPYGQAKPCDWIREVLVVPTPDIEFYKIDGYNYLFADLVYKEYPRMLSVVSVYKNEEDGTFTNIGQEIGYDKGDGVKKYTYTFEIEEVGTYCMTYNIKPSWETLIDLPPNESDCLEIDACDLDTSHPELIFDVQNESEPNANDGSITVTVANATNGVLSLLDFRWEYDALNTSNVAAGLGAGTYCVWVGTGLCPPRYYCRTIGTVPCEIEGLPSCEPLLEISTTSSYPNDTNGTIEVTNLGTNNYIYYWSDLYGAVSNPDRDNLPPGTYTLKVYKEESCCEDIIPVEIETGCKLGMSYEINPICGQNSATIDLKVFNGFLPYEYNWGHTIGNDQITINSSGFYNVTITDAKGCIIEEEIEAILPEPISIDLFTRATCGEGNGIAEVSVTGGTAPFTYNWSDLGGSTNTNFRTNLAPGDYSVMVTDAKECGSKVLFFQIKESPALKVDSKVNIPCSGVGRSVTLQPLGGTPPYTYQWSNGNTTSQIYDVPPNTYIALVTDAMGCIVALEFDLNYTTEIEVDLIIKPAIIGCSINTGSVMVEAMGGKKPYIYRIVGHSLTIPLTIQQNPFFDNLVADSYSLIVTDACGNLLEQDFIIEEIENENQYDIILTPTSSCHISSGGAIELQLDGHCNGCTYTWSNGANTPSLNNVATGNYNVTVTDGLGCEQQAETTIELVENDLSFGFDSENSCGNLDNGSAQITDVGGVGYQFQWSTGETTQSIEGLSSGYYYVTVTSETGCSQGISFYIDNIAELDYSQETIKYYNSNPPNGTSATVRIISDMINSGPYAGSSRIKLIETGNLFPVLQGNNFVDVHIPISLRDKEILHFEYLSFDGCVFEGTIENVPVCGPIDSFSFSIEDPGGDKGDCGLGQHHKVKLKIHSQGTNFPYFIHITMIEAHSPDDSDYEIIKEINYNLSDITFNNVPSGLIKIKTSNYCEDHFHSREYFTCCNEFSCDYSEGSTADHGCSYIYGFPFFSLHVEEQVFDGACWAVDWHCSKVTTKIGHAQPDNCWSGFIKIQYPNYLIDLYKVTDSTHPAEGGSVEFIGGPQKWHPDEPGSYPIIVEYIGVGASLGDDCSQTVDAVFYSNDGNDAIVYLNDNVPNNSNVVSPWDDAYIVSRACGLCDSKPTLFDGEEYVFDRKDCGRELNNPSTFFRLTPKDWDDPCNSGGTITIVDYNSVGEVVLIDDAEIKDDVKAILENPGQQVWLGSDQWCDKSGWCLFDAMDIYGHEFEKPIFALWHDPESCYTQEPIDCPAPCAEDEDCIDGECEPTLCDPICNEGFDCHDGECLPICPEGECETGFCVDGVCVEEPCDGQCDPEECIQGICVGSDCYFHKHVERAPYGNHISRKWNHNIPLGAKLKWEGRRGSHLKFSIEGAVEKYQFCGTGDNNMETEWEIKYPDQKIIVNWYEEPCLGFGANTFDMTFSCSNGPNLKGETIESRNNQKLDIEKENIEYGSEFFIHPNPFKNNLIISTSNLIEPFESEVAVLDKWGRKLMEQKVTFQKGENIFNLDSLDDLSSGIYIVIIKKDGMIYKSNKLIKVD